MGNGCLTQVLPSRKALAIYSAGLVEAELLKHAQQIGGFHHIREAHALLLQLVLAIEAIPDEA